LTDNKKMSYIALMPTDGADFGRKRGCYGKAYSMARDGADDADVAECVMRGVERDIRRDGGAPAFPVAVDILVLVSGGDGNSQRLLAGADTIRRDFVDSPLTRDFAAAVEKIGLSAIAEGRGLVRKHPWPALCAKWPDLLRNEIELNSPAFRESTINLLRRHVDEWRSFSSALHFGPVSLAA